MDTTWLPHWTTAIALASGLGGVFCPKLPTRSMGASASFQEKSLEGMILFFGGFIIVIALTVLGTLDVIFLIIGWSRSPWGWSAAGVALLLWIIWRFRQLLERVADPQGAARPADSEHHQSLTGTTKKSGPADGGEDGH